MNFDKITSGDTIYHFNCGCFSETKSTRINNQVKCSKHFKPMICKYRKCNLCKEWFEVSNRANARIYFCEDCRPENQKMLLANYRAQHKNNEKTFEQIKIIDPIEKDLEEIDLLECLNSNLKMPEIKEFPFIFNLLNKTQGRSSHANPNQ